MNFDEGSVISRVGSESVLNSAAGVTEVLLVEVHRDGVGCGEMLSLASTLILNSEEDEERKKPLREDRIGSGSRHDNRELARCRAEGEMAR